MRKFLTLIPAALLLLFPLAAHATIEQLAADAPGISGMWGDIGKIFPHTGFGASGFAYVLVTMIDIILRFIGGLAVLMIIFGGIRMMMTVADENSHSEAKKIVMYACLGLILAIMGDGIISYVVSLVGSAAG